MSYVYRIQFTRYNSGECRRTITPECAFEIEAESFRDAFSRATDMLKGMTAADPVSDYEIAEITCASYTVRPNLHAELDDPFGIIQE